MGKFPTLNRWTVTAGVLGLSLLLAVWLILGPLRAQIGMALFERQVGQLVGTDRTEALDDGLHVFLCGTGSPLPDPARAGPCTAVLAGETALVFDAGSGSIRTLARMGFPVGETRQMFLTHLHSDHIDGLGELLLQAWVGGGRSVPLTIAGPVGTGEVVAGFNQAYSLDAGYRTAHHGEDIANPAGFGGTADEIVFGDGETRKTVYEADGVKVTAIPVDHAPVAPAMGYRIDYKGRSVTLSGDTVRSDAVIALAEDTDLLIHEALNRDMVSSMADAADANGDPSLAHIFTDILDYHTSPEEAAMVAEQAGAGMLVLTHIVPPLPSAYLNAAFLGDAPERFSGRLLVGRDGQVISLPADSERISVSSGLD